MYRRPCAPTSGCIPELRRGGPKSQIKRRKNAPNLWPPAVLNICVLLESKEHRRKSRYSRLPPIYWRARRKTGKLGIRLKEIPRETSNTYVSTMAGETSPIDLDRPTSEASTLLSRAPRWGLGPGARQGKYTQTQRKRQGGGTNDARAGQERARGHTHTRTHTQVHTFYTGAGE